MELYGEILQNLQQEEAIEKQGGGTWQMGLDEEELQNGGQGTGELDVAELSEEEMRQLMQELQELQEEMAELAMENDLEELEQLVNLDMDPAELEQLKKKHRSDEMREIMEADMKYLRALFGQLAREQQEAAANASGVALELSGVNIPVAVDTRSAAQVAGVDAQAAEGGTVDVSL